ncbi:hypothetical protein ACVWV7_000223 [Aeromonas hydrophila]
MSRAVNEDYKKLVCFIENYSIHTAYDEEHLKKYIKPLHKSYFSVLTVMAELIHQDAQPQSLFSDREKEEQIDIFWQYLNESISELGSSFFLILNGCYKAAEQVLRSSIENFTKAHGSLDIKDIHKTKSVYTIFDLASNYSFFFDGVGKVFFKKLKILYGELCSAVHTGAPKDMQAISALGDFPIMDSDRLISTHNKYLEVVKIYVSSLTALFVKNYHKMHHTNMDIISPLLTKDVTNMLYPK